MGEFPVARPGAEDDLLVGSGSADRHHPRFRKAYLPAEGVSVESLTTKLCGFSVSGPEARGLLPGLCDADLDPPGPGAMAAPAGCRADRRAEAILTRVACTGKLGHKVLFPAPAHLPLLRAPLRAGADLDVTLAGIRALNALRVEKGDGAMGVEYAPDRTPFEAGMVRLVRFDKGEFLGRGAALAARDAAPRRVFRQFDIATTDGEPWGGKPVTREGRVTGYLTSAVFGHRVGHCVALGHMRGDHAGTTDGLYVDVLGERREVTVRTRA